MVKKLTAYLMIFTSLLSMTACWDHVEISEMSIIAGIGLDTDISGKGYRVTAEIINVEAEGGENISAEIVEGEGATVYSAIQNAMQLSGGAMFGNHCKVFIIGDALARRGINETVDLILRSPGFRKTVDVMVAKDSSAKEILKQKTVKNDIVSYELGKMLKSNAESVKNTSSTNAYRIHEALLSDNACFVVPSVYARQNNGESVLEVDGYAVFTRDRLTGFLDGNQSKLFNLLTRDSDGMTLTLENIKPSEKPVDIKITNSDISLTPVIWGEGLSMGISVRAKAVLESGVSLDADLSDEQTLNQIQDDINRELSKVIENLITDVRLLYGADIFGFYREYEDRYRREWTTLRKDWQSEFRGIAVSVSPDVKIKGSGLVSNYFPSDSGGANALP